MTTDHPDDMPLREIVEPLRKMSDRELQVNRWLAAAEAVNHDQEAKSWRKLEMLFAGEYDRRRIVLADLDAQAEGLR